MILRLLTAAATAATLTSPAHPADGLWRSEGYGMVVSVTNGTPIGYAVTRLSCAPADLTGASVTPGRLRFPGVAGGSEQPCVGSRPGTREPSAALRDRVLESTDAHLGVPVTTVGDNQLISYATLPGDIGYLRLHNRSRYGRPPGRASPARSRC